MRVQTSLKKFWHKTNSEESYNTEGKTHMIMIWKFLSQLCVKKYGIATMCEFHNKFKTIARERHNSGSEYKKTWLVSCDINDAFGSIRLDKLNNILIILCIQKEREREMLKIRLEM